MELEPSTHFRLEPDPRRSIPVPPPVSLNTIDDAMLRATTGFERELDAFYVGLLQFERDLKCDRVVYKAENFRLRFEFVEGQVIRDDMMMLGIVVKSLADTAKKFDEAKVTFSRERGITAGEERLLLLDPAGNWIRVTQSKRIV